MPGPFFGIMTYLIFFGFVTGPDFGDMTIEVFFGIVTSPPFLGLVIWYSARYAIGTFDQYYGTHYDISLITIENHKTTKKT